MPLGSFSSLVPSFPGSSPNLNPADFPVITPVTASSGKMTVLDISTGKRIPPPSGCLPRFGYITEAQYSINKLPATAICISGRNNNNAEQKKHKISSRFHRHSKAPFLIIFEATYIHPTMKIPKPSMCQISWVRAYW